jgi:crotonobetainyl-CoA:carnitine CoA-transferase CaiB-like acyl-CoA transferase
MAAEFYRGLTSHGPLEGLTVLETITYAGPVAAAELADLGAEVIKCELPVTGDVCLCLGRACRTPRPRMLAPFLSINRNKRSP